MGLPAFRTSVGPVPHSRQNRRHSQVQARKRKTGNDVGRGKWKSHNSDAPASYETTANNIQKECEPSGDKILKLRQLKKELDAKREKKPNPVEGGHLLPRLPYHQNGASPMKILLNPTPSKMTSLKKTTPSPSPVPSIQTTPVSTPNATPSQSPQKHDSSKYQQSPDISYAGKKGETTSWSRGRRLLYIREANTKTMGGKDVEKTPNFPKAKRVFTVVRSGPDARQIWGTIEETNVKSSTCPPLAYFNYFNVKRFR